MKYNDMVLLIQAFEASERYARIVREMTGGQPITNELWDVSGKLYEILRNNSIYADRDDDNAEDTFGAIVYAINKDPKEKAKLLLGIYDE